MIQFPFLLSGSLFQLALFQKKPTSAAEIFSHMPCSSRFRVSTILIPEFLKRNLSMKEPRLPVRRREPYVNSNKMVPLLILFPASADSEFSFAGCNVGSTQQFSVPVCTIQTIANLQTIGIGCLCLYTDTDTDLIFRALTSDGIYRR